MTYPMLNADLLQRTLTHIIDSPAGWDQNVWRSIYKDADQIATLGATQCGAAMCFAGEAIQLHDPEAWLINAEVITELARRRDRELTLVLDYYAEYVLDPSGIPLEIDEEIAVLRGVPSTVVVKSAMTQARDLLGLGADEANVLFDESNSLTDLQAMVATLLAGFRGAENLAAVRYDIRES